MSVILCAAFDTVKEVPVRRPICSLVGSSLQPSEPQGFVLGELSVFPKVCSGDPRSSSCRCQQQRPIVGKSIGRLKLRCQKQGMQSQGIDSGFEQHCSNTAQSLGRGSKAHRNVGTIHEHFGLTWPSSSKQHMGRSLIKWFVCSLSNAT